MESTITIEASENPIKSVTVFKSSKAEVVRLFYLHLKKGRNKIGIKGLSTDIDAQSVRVSGLRDARLFDVTCTHVDSKAALPHPGSLVENKRALFATKTLLESERNLRKEESKLLLQYGQTLNGEHITHGQMSAFLQSYVDQGRKTLQAISKLEEEIDDVNRRLDILDAQIASKKGSALGQVDIVVVAEEEDSVEMKLTYIVSNVYWTPTYELHATTVNGKPSSFVSLHYQARVSQSTGEDWNSTTLTLSTIASDTVVKRIPELHPIKVRPKFSPQRTSYSNNGLSQMQQSMIYGQQQMQQQFPMQQMDFFDTLTAVPQAMPSSAEGAFEEIGGIGAITERTTVVSETPIAISFSVYGESTIPSDGVEHQVSVAIPLFEATISYLCIPRINPRVFLQCVVKNTSEYRLLPGPVNVIFDDSYVSKTSINDVNTGDTFECTLGDDPSTKVTYLRTAKTTKSNGGAFSEVTNTTVYKTKINIHNKHQFEITDLVVRDIIPTSDDKRASIVLRKPIGLADSKNGDYVDLKDDGL
ncbi:Protein F37C4.5 [Psilocybe cubensis]|uniref:Protein F37C4.5 n=2 Tax=Psilocybe cubensis TaxID=181762 RepID=A0ACB8GQ23_PSICU|nr:Protein F37C4.5 [Psilocybe cubensis]KAH9477517.1 Protein F37C4.5 [Psilocybe cubensis]